MRVCEIRKLIVNRKRKHKPNKKRERETAISFFIIEVLRLFMA